MGIFLKLTAVLGHTLCQQKETRFVLVTAEYWWLSFGLGPGYQGSAAERKEKGSETLIFPALLFVPITQQRLEPLQQVTVPAQLSLGAATGAADVGTL